MGTGSLRRQVPPPGAAECWNPLLFWNCVCTSSFAHPQGPEQPLAVAPAGFCCAPSTLSSAPSVGTVPFPLWGTDCILPHTAAPLPSQLKLPRTCWTGEQWWKKLQETISTIPATAREVFVRQGHPGAFKEAGRRPCPFLPNLCCTTDSCTLCPPGSLRAHWEHSDIHQLTFLYHLTSGFSFWDVSCWSWCWEAVLTGNYRGNYFG